MVLTLGGLPDIALHAAFQLQIPRRHLHRLVARTPRVEGENNRALRAIRIAVALLPNGPGTGERSAPPRLREK